MVFAQLLASHAGEIGALVEKLQQRSFVHEAGTPNHIPNIVTIQPVIRGKENEIIHTLLKLMGQKDPGGWAVHLINWHKFVIVRENVKYTRRSAIFQRNGHAPLAGYQANIANRLGPIKRGVLP